MAKAKATTDPDKIVYTVTAATVNHAVGDEVTGEQVRKAGGSVEFLLASNHLTRKG